uniref:Uncharacterized protein n=1 Tax=Zooxanthella nutricula TaxID=1333877 RepID=A0A6U6PJE9_9DINO
MATIFEAAASGDIGAMNGFMDVDDWEPDAIDDSGCTALHYAARTGEAAAGALLLECDASPNIADKMGNTPLIYAGIFNKRLVASMLLWGQADPSMTNLKGNTALHEAALVGSQDVAWLIVENGGEHTVLLQNADGKTPLELARAGGNPELTEMLEKSFKEMTEKKNEPE